MKVKKHLIKGEGYIIVYYIFHGKYFICYL